MSNLKQVQNQVKKIDSYLVTIQRTLLVTIFSWIFVVLSSQNKYYKVIHQKTGLILLICVQIARIIINYDFIKFVINIISKYGKRIQKFFNLTWIDDVSTILIILSIITGAVIKGHGTKLDHYKLQDEVSQNKIKSNIKIWTIVQISLTAILLGFAIYKLFKKRKQSEFRKLVQVARDTNLDKNDAIKMYKFTKKNGFDINKMKDELIANFKESLLKVLKSKKLPPELRKRLKLIEKEILKSKEKIKKRVKKLKKRLKKLQEKSRK